MIPSGHRAASSRSPFPEGFEATAELAAAQRDDHPGRFRDQFTGACYRAANWIHLGVTQGRGRMDREKQRQGACPKQIFVYPLVPAARELLGAEG